MTILINISVTDKTVSFAHKFGYTTIAFEVDEYP